jgi:hypothetical protein
MQIFVGRNLLEYLYLEASRDQMVTTKTDLGGVGYGDARWMELAQNRVQ